MYSACTGNIGTPTCACTVRIRHAERGYSCFTRLFWLQWQPLCSLSCLDSLERSDLRECAGLSRVTTGGVSWECALPSSVRW